MQISGYSREPAFPDGTKKPPGSLAALLKSLDWINQPDRNPSSANGIGNA
jgi:hypothetical protein